MSLEKPCYRPEWSRVILLATSILLVFASMARAEATVFTLWPLIDVRHSPADGYTSVNLLGPFGKFEQTRRETRFGLRPLFFHQHGRNDDAATDEVLYPVATGLKNGDAQNLQVLHWLTWDTSPRPGGGGAHREFMLFPFLFYGDSGTGRGSTAFFPIAGHIEGMFGRDRIDFFLFPLYSATRRGETETTNVLWPVFSRIRGPGESGWAFWPLAGWADREGVYHKRFYLWPFWTANDLALDTADPVRVRSVFPFWSSERSVARTQESILWPFFNHTEDARENYEEWDFPWPLLRMTRGENRHGWRALPLYADETIRSNRKRWWLWPCYKIEEHKTEQWSFRRDRILFFLYSDQVEKEPGVELPRLRRVAFWPLFTYEARDGVSSFATLALLEPFFPTNDRIARNWAPLWHLYQARWDSAGNGVSSLLWNLYWKERRSDALAWELFPLLSYRHRDREMLDLSVLKGFLRYHADVDGARLRLLFLPWGIPVGAGMQTAGGGGG